MYLCPRHGSGLFVSRTCICSLSSRRSRNVLMQFMDSEYNLSAPIRRYLSASTCLTVWCGIHKWCCTIGWPRSYHNFAISCWRIGGSKWRLNAAKVCGRLRFASTELSWALPKNIWQSVRQPESQPVSAATCLWVSANDRAEQLRLSSGSLNARGVWVRLDSECELWVLLGLVARPWNRLPVRLTLAATSTSARRA